MVATKFGPPVLPPPKVIDVQGVSTTYYRAGTGNPVVLIYGGNFGSGDSASSGYTWNLNFAPLAEHFDVIVLDKLGQGFTDNPRRIEDYTMTSVVSHAAQFLRALGLPPVHLVGHSRGGYAATRLTMTYPELVHSVTIISSGTLSPRLSTNDIVLSGCPFPAGSREAARWVYEGYSYDPSVVTPDWLDAIATVMEQPKHKEAVRMMVQEKAGSRYFLPDLAAQKRDTLAWLRDGGLQRPTQIIFGQDDRTVNVEGAFQLYEMVAAHQRQTELHIVNKAGHFCFREHPALFNSLLGSFVDLVMR
jgi:2-hydroxy-6-oxonona-2,4-dienedioate hydrolase